VPETRIAAAADIKSDKSDLRRQAADRRRTVVLASPRAGIDMRDRFLATITPAPGIAVSAYWPLDDEFDPRPLFTELHRRGHPIGLPVIVRKGEPLLFRRWTPDVTLVRGSFRVMTPPADSPEVVPQLLLVPLLAFDRAGYRLGYGGGFYDRTIAKLRKAGDILAVGVALAAQEVASVPRDDTDEPLDWVVTDREAIRISNRQSALSPSLKADG
jgi:5-formyltetrahydrofolate cyclo-ligase